MSKQLLMHWPTETTGPNGVIPLDLTFADLMGESVPVSSTVQLESLSTPRVSLRSLSDSELSRCKMLKEQGCNMLNLLPKPTKCSDEQLALALGYLFTLGDQELVDRLEYANSMKKFLSLESTKRSHKSLKLRNLKIYIDLLEQVITARVHSRLKADK